jgi:ankyrin repeat protein
MAASQTGHSGIVPLLLSAGANVSAATTDNGYTALMWASQNRHSGIVPLLLSAGANVNAARTDYGYTALMLA